MLMLTILTMYQLSYFSQTLFVLVFILFFFCIYLPLLVNKDFHFYPLVNHMQLILHKNGTKWPANFPLITQIFYEFVLTHIIGSVRRWPINKHLFVLELKNKMFWEWKLLTQMTQSWPSHQSKTILMLSTQLVVWTRRNVCLWHGIYTVSQKNCANLFFVRRSNVKFWPIVNVFWHETIILLNKPFFYFTVW